MDETMKIKLELNPSAVARFIGDAILASFKDRDVGWTTKCIVSV
jgi:hypothetical protein